MKNKTIAFHKKSFNVPVTKRLDKESLMFVIKDFKRKKISFCIYDFVKLGNNVIEIWRKTDKNDLDQIKKAVPNKAPSELYLNGKKIDMDKINIM
jgi:hypothetical protein